MNYIFFSSDALRMQAKVPDLVTSVKMNHDGVHEMTVKIHSPIDLLSFMHAAIEVGMDKIINLKTQTSETK